MNIIVFATTNIEKKMNHLMFHLWLIKMLSRYKILKVNTSQILIKIIQIMNRVLQLAKWSSHIEQE